MQRQILEEAALVWVTLRGKRFCFRTNGKEMLDAGTELLIEHMNIAPAAIVLDLSCGYGAKGIVAAGLATQGHVHMVDAQANAITLAQENAAINYVKKRIEAYMSDGFSGIEKGRTFHAILFTMPEGMKKDTFVAFVTTAKDYLKPGGKLYLSTTAVLRHFVKDLLENEYNNFEKIVSGKGYILFSATKI